MDQEKLQQIQFLEQNLQSILMQKQAFQMELSETASALKEIEKSKDTLYKIIGQLMISTSKEKTIGELKDKEKLIETRIKMIDNQEKELQKQAQDIKKGFMDSANKK